MGPGGQVIDTEVAEDQVELLVVAEGAVPRRPQRRGQPPEEMVGRMAEVGVAAIRVGEQVARDQWGRFV